MIYLYDAKASPEELGSNGLVTPTLMRAIVREVINGEFSCEVDSLTEIEENQIIKLPLPDGSEELFRLSEPSRSMDHVTGRLIYHAEGWHISYDLMHEMIQNRHLVDMTAADAVKTIVTGGIQEARFTGTSDIEASATLYVQLRNPIDALIGMNDASFVSRWGGEIYRHGWHVDMLSRRGKESGQVIEYRHNLTGFKLSIDSTAVVNRIIPTYLTENQSLAFIPETYVDSPNIALMPVPHVSHVHFGDIQIGRTDQDSDQILYPTAASAEHEVRERVRRLYDNDHVDIPVFTAKVNFIDLADTLEYKDIEKSLRLNIGDTITVRYMDRLIKLRVVSYRYDALGCRYEEITLGDNSVDLAQITARLSSEIQSSAKLEWQREIGQTVTPLIEAQGQLNKVVARSMGYYTTDVEGDQGKKIRYMHDKPTLEKSTYIAMVNDVGQYVWTTSGWRNGSPIWQYGTTKDGNAIYRSIVTGSLLANLIDASMIRAGAITSSKIAAGAVTAAEISSRTITADKIAYGTITGDQIRSNSISVDKLQAFQISADQIKTGRLQSNRGGSYIDLDYGTAYFTGDIRAANIQNTSWNSNNMSIGSSGIQSTTSANANQFSFNSGTIASGVRIGNYMYASGTGIYVNGNGYVCSFETMGNAWIAIHRGSDNARFSASNLIWGVGTNGTVYTSDLSTKKNVKRLDLDLALDFVKSTSLWEFDRRQDDQHSVGVIANLVERSTNPLAQLVTGKYTSPEGDSVRIANYGNMAIVNMGAVKALANKVDALESKKNELIKRVDRLEQEILSREV
jgi:phage minor structural protein